jgi:hypothetical protein
MPIALTMLEATPVGIPWFLYKIMQFPPDRIIAMKTTIFALCFLCATAAFGQNAPVLSNNPQLTEVPDHPQHASQHAMGQESSLLGTSSYTYAQGERPLWEFGTDKHETPLGDIARAYRKERAAATVAKATKVSEN